MTPSTTRPVPSSPFGSRTRTAVLLLLVERGQAHLRELARHLGSPLSVVQHALRTLERDGLVACQMSGRVRLARLDLWLKRSRLPRIDNTQYVELLDGKVGYIDD